MTVPQFIAERFLLVNHKATMKTTYPNKLMALLERELLATFSGTKVPIRITAIVIMAAPGTRSRSGTWDFARTAVCFQANWSGLVSHAH